MKNSSLLLSDNQNSARSWNLSGPGYDHLSMTLTDAIQKCIALVEPRSTERILDLACGTGLGARLLAKAFPGVKVFGIDIADQLIEAARDFARQEGQNIEFLVAEAENLPFEDQEFDCIISSFGIEFMSHPENVISELIRVSKSQSRLAFTAWRPSEVIAEMSKIFSRFVQGLESNTEIDIYPWANPIYIEKKLGRYFKLHYEEGITYLERPTAEAVWRLLAENHGPTKNFVKNLSPAEKDELDREMIQFMSQFKTSSGIRLPRHYLATVGYCKY